MIKTQDVLKESLGIDVSKDSLSFCLGVLNADLSKTFILGSDVTITINGIAMAYLQGTTGIMVKSVTYAFSADIVLSIS